MFNTSRTTIALVAVLGLSAGCSGSGGQGFPTGALVSALGAGLGSVGGGALGSLVGSGTGQTLATAGGAIVGGAVGGVGARSLYDANAQPATAQAQYQVQPQQYQTQPQYNVGTSYPQPASTVTYQTAQPTYTAAPEQIFIEPASVGTYAGAPQTSTVYAQPSQYVAPTSYVESYAQPTTYTAPTSYAAPATAYSAPTSYAIPSTGYANTALPTVGTSAFTGSTQTISQTVIPQTAVPAYTIQSPSFSQGSSFAPAVQTGSSFNSVVPTF